MTPAIFLPRLLSHLRRPKHGTLGEVVHVPEFEALPQIKLRKEQDAVPSE